MLNVIRILCLLFFACCQLSGQSLPAVNDNSPTTSTPAMTMTADQEIEDAVFNRRNRLPDSPTPKTTQEDAACPGGTGRPCALLGGRLYFADEWHMNEHEKTWWDAMKTPGMLFAAGTMVGATIFDIQESQACIDAHRCREANPLLGQHPLARKYAVAMSLNAVLIWSSVREKQHGRGLLPIAVMWASTMAHMYFGAEGFANAHHH